MCNELLKWKLLEIVPMLFVLPAFFLVGKVRIFRRGLRILSLSSSRNFCSCKMKRCLQNIQLGGRWLLLASSDLHLHVLNHSFDNPEQGFHICCLSGLMAVIF